MKTIVSLVLLMATASAFAQQYPQPKGYVSDFANVLTSEQVASLNKDLIAFEKKTSMEIAVVTVPSLNGQSIEAYAQELGKTWGVGKQEKNNGVVFLTAPTERKMRIQTASGVSAKLTNAQCDRIRDNVILPRFRSGNMGQGIIDGTHAIMQALDDEAAPQSHQWTSAHTKVLGSIVIVCLLLFLVVNKIRRSEARKYVLENKYVVASRLTEAKKTAEHTDVREGTRQRLRQLEENLASIDEVITQPNRVNWLYLREEIDLTDTRVRQLDIDMRREIDFAEEARREGPELLKKIPGMIEAATANLANGRNSARARQHLDNARQAYERVQHHEQSFGSIADWVFVYFMLRSIQQDVANAERERDPRSHDMSSDSNHSPGFGNNGGFGGGGGFDSGGGSSGSW